MYSGSTDFLFAQTVGVASVFIFCVVGASILFGSIKAIVGLRVSDEEEMEGLDIHEHGNLAYPDFVSAMSGISKSFASGIASAVEQRTTQASRVFLSESGKT
jgi:hypothetical protein